MPGDLWFVDAIMDFVSQLRVSSVYKQVHPEERYSTTTTKAEAKRTVRKRADATKSD